MNEIQQSLNRFLPEMALTAGLCWWCSWTPRGAAEGARGQRVLTVADLAGRLGALPEPAGLSDEIFSGMLTVDPLGLFFKALPHRRLAAGRRSSSPSATRASCSGLGQGEFYAPAAGGHAARTCCMATANDLAMLYLALEMVSITSYVMVAYMKGDRMSERGLAEVHPLRRGLHGRDALRPVAPLRAHGHDQPARHPRVPGRRTSPTPTASPLLR